VTTLKSKVLLLSAGAIVLVLCVTSVVGMSVLHDQVRDVVGTEQLSMVSRVAVEIDKHIETTRGVLIAAATEVPPEVLANAEAAQRFMESRFAVKSIFDDLVLCDASARVIGEVPRRNRIGDSYADLDHLRATVRTGRPQISRPQLGRKIGEPIVVFTAPVHDRNGTVVGVLIGTIELFGHNFLGDLAAARVGETGMYALFGRDRTVIVSRDKERILKEGPSPGISPYFDHAMAGQEGWEEAVNSRGLHAIYSYVGLHAAPWTLVAALPADEAFAPLAAARNRILQFAALSALVLLAALWFLCGRMFAPLEALRSTIRRLRSNPGEAHVTGISGKDEIGALAADFDALMRERHESHSALRESEARFRSLVSSVKDYAIFLLDPRGYVASWNEGAARIKRYTAEQIVGRHFSCFYPPEAMAKGVPDRLLREAQEKGRAEDESWRIRRDGSRFWANATITRLTDESGGTIGFVKIVRDLTDRRDASAALAEREARLDAFMKHSGLPMFIKDLQGRYVLVNEKFLNCFGLAADDVIGRCDDQIFKPDIARAFMANDALVMSKAAPFQVDEGAWYVDGWHTSIVCKFPIHDSEGVMIGVAGVATDITERRQAEKALQVSERRLRLIADHVPAMIAYIDTEQRCRYVNRIAEDWLGAAASSCAGRPIREMWGDRIHAEIDASLKQALEGRTVDLQFEGPLFHSGSDAAAGDRTRRLHLHCVPDLNDQQGCEGVYLLATDITAQQLAEQTLRESEARFRAIGDASPVGVFVTDRHGRDIYVNSRYTEITGMTLEEAQGEGWRRGVHAADRDVVMNAWRVCIGSGQPYEGDIRFVRPDATTVWTHVKANPNLDGPGLWGYVGTVEDITRRKEAEHHLSSLAHMDALTGLPNRVLFNDRLDTAMARRARSGRMLGLMYLDIDHFKSVNDSIGHAAGDELLRAVAKRLLDAVRTSDTVARMGGDEFVIILEELHSGRDACIVADKILAGMEEPVGLEDRPLRVSVSIGIACAADQDGATLLRRADRALYSAKKAGRGRYVVADDVSSNVVALPGHAR